MSIPHDKEIYACFCYFIPDLVCIRSIVAVQDGIHTRMLDLFPAERQTVYHSACCVQLERDEYENKLKSQISEYENGRETPAHSTITNVLSYSDQARSKRSRFMTLFHAATKSWMNFSCESSQA